MKKFFGWLGAAVLAASEIPSLVPYKPILVIVASGLMGAAHNAPAPR